MSTLDKQAIQAALSGRWSDAVSLNQQIVSEDTKNIDAMNRLAYAHAKCGNYKEACTIYQKVLKVDSYNPLATKNLAKFKEYHNSPKKNGNANAGATIISPSLFLSEAEKTKTVNLLNLASQSLLQDLPVGIEVYAVPKRFELHIKTHDQQYIGTLPDDVGHPILKLFKKNSHPGCRFFIKDIGGNRVTIFIRF